MNKQSRPMGPDRYRLGDKHGCPDFDFLTLDADSDEVKLGACQCEFVHIGAYEQLMNKAKCLAVALAKQYGDIVFTHTDLVHPETKTALESWQEYLKTLGE